MTPNRARPLATDVLREAKARLDANAALRAKHLAALFDCHVSSVYRLPGLRFIEVEGLGRRYPAADVKLYLSLNERRQAAPKPRQRKRAS